MDIFFLLLFGHSLADFGLQSERLIKHKHFAKNKDTWMYYLTAHSIMHGGLVGFFTGSLFLSLLEIISHWLIDYGKMSGKYNFHADQMLHIGCKVVWVVLLKNGIA